MLVSSIYHVRLVSYNNFRDSQANMCTVCQQVLGLVFLFDTMNLIVVALFTVDGIEAEVAALPDPPKTNPGESKFTLHFPFLIMPYI